MWAIYDTEIRYNITRRKKWEESVMDIQNAVIERIKDIIEIKGITVNEVAVRFKVAPSTLKNILYEVRKRTYV